MSDWRAAVAGRTVAAWALLPLRAFLGVTYLYAGIDKLLSPHFFVAGDPFSVAAQMEGFARTSPLAPLIEASMGAAIPIGALIALGELAVGLGLLTGLAFRLSAWGGFVLSILFWLTASWSSTPYFFSPDLPYAFGFLTLALTGHGGLLALDPGGRRRSPRSDVGAADGPATGDASGASTAAGAPASPARRALLQVGILAALTAFAAITITRLRAFGADDAASGAANAARTPAPRPTNLATPTPAATAAPTAAATAVPVTAAPTAAPTPVPTAQPTAAPPASAPPTAATGPVMGNVTDLASAKSLAINVPNEAPFALNPGGPGILVELPDGRIVGYSAVCTHGRCTVAYDAPNNQLLCPCHLGRFDPANAGAVLGGPPPLPLPEIPLAVDGSGQIVLVLPA